MYDDAGLYYCEISNGVGVTQPGTRINRGRRGTAISEIWPSRSRYQENERDNREKWNPKKSLKIMYWQYDYLSSVSHDYRL